PAHHDPANDRAPGDAAQPGRAAGRPSSCKPVYPHQYLQVNTVFEVTQAPGPRTAWSDKHPGAVARTSVTGACGCLNLPGRRVSRRGWSEGAVPRGPDWWAA